MSAPKLGHYRGTVNQIKSQYKITGLDFDILLYAAEQDVVTRYELKKNVSPAVSSIKGSVEYLVRRKFLRLVRKARTGPGGMPATYSITPSARKIVTEFYMRMFPNF